MTWPFRLHDLAQALFFLDGKESNAVVVFNYWAASAKEFDYKLKPSTYSLEAQFIGFIGTDRCLPLAAVRGQGLLLHMVTPNLV